MAGSKCIYCGFGSITPSHLEQCKKYKMVVDEELGDNQVDKFVRLVVVASYS